MKKTIKLLAASALILASSIGTSFGAPDPNGDISSQVNALQNLLANGANVIVFAPLDAAGIVPAVKRANEKGALVFSIDDGPAGGEVTATVRADNLNAGAQGAEEMVRRLKSKACWTQNSCSVLELQGGLATPNGLDR
ncbi:MAG: substrate-binding domain-containing protein, partial [Burkholderiaceae bacterium]